MQSSQSISSLGRVLGFVVKGESDFCSLCFKIDRITNLHDELSIEINEADQNVTAADILQSVFGNEIQDYLSMFENVCKECLKSIIEIYKFIQTCQYNTMLLTNALDKLNDSCTNIKSGNGNTKSLFVMFNPVDFTSKNLFDRIKLDSPKAALKRLETLIPQKREVSVIKKAPQSTSKAYIKTSDMLLEPNNKHIYKCRMCHKPYTKTWKLRQHFMNDHVLNQYKCPHCSKAYNSTDLLTYHEKEHHTESHCNECGKTYKNRVELKRHRLMCHMKLVCSTCGRSYKSHCTFKKHLEFNVCAQECRASPANARYTCDYCGKKYTQKMSLRVHIQYDHGTYQPHICEWCGKKFWAQSRLKAHIVKHTREKNFTCSICQGKFVTKESLLYHTRLHTGEKPYRCHECGSSFISASRRAHHMKTYHLLATVECDVCHAKFTSVLYLDKHKKCHKQSSLMNGKEIDSKTSITKLATKGNEKSVVQKIIEHNKMPNERFLENFNRSVIVRMQRNKNK